MYVLVMKQLITMSLIGLGGFIFAKIFKVCETERKFLSKLLLYFINPFMIVNSFNQDFDAQKFKQLLFVVLAALLVHIFMIILGAFTSKDKIDRLAVAFTNCGFVGIPLVRGVFGDEGVFFLMGYLVIFNTLVWTYGYFQIGGAISIKKSILNPNVVAIFCGLILYCLPIHVPEFLMKPINMIGDLNTAVSMILIGILIADFHLNETKSYILKLSKTVLLRLVGTGFITILVLFVLSRIFTFIPNINTLCFVVLIASLCPTATSIPGLACVFNKDATYASLLVSVTSVVCLFTLPMMIALAELVIH